MEVIIENNDLEIRKLWTCLQYEKHSVLAVQKEYEEKYEMKLGRRLGCIWAALHILNREEMYSVMTFRGKSLEARLENR